jgi:hypothetical protein
MDYQIQNMYDKNSNRSKSIEPMIKKKSNLLQGTFGKNYN